MTPHRKVKQFINGMGYVKARYIPVYYINISDKISLPLQRANLVKSLQEAEEDVKYMAALFLFWYNPQKSTVSAMWMYRHDHGIRYVHLSPKATGNGGDYNKAKVLGDLLDDEPSAREGLSISLETVDMVCMPDQLAKMDHGMQCLCWSISQYARFTDETDEIIPDNASIDHTVAMIDKMMEADTRPDFGDVTWMAPPADRLQVPTTHTEYITYALTHKDLSLTITSIYTQFDELMRVCKEHAVEMEYYRGHAYQSSEVPRIKVHVLSIEHADAFFPSIDTLIVLITKFRHSHLEPFKDERPPFMPYVWFHAMSTDVRHRYAINGGVRNSSQVCLSLVPLHEYILYRDLVCMSIGDIVRITKCCVDRRDELLRRADGV